MKYIFIFSAFLSLISCKTNKESLVNSQENSINKSFEGIIKYKFLMENVHGLSAEQIESRIKESEQMIGRHLVVSVKEPKMKSVLDGELMKYYTYYNSTDSMYFHSPDLGETGKISTYDNWNFKYDTIISTKNALTINGKACDLIKFKSRDYEWNYYYNNELKVNPDNFKHYKDYFWDKAIEMSKSLPIRYEGKIPAGYIYMEAEYILDQQLEDSIFEIPKN